MSGDVRMAFFTATVRVTNASRCVLTVFALLSLMAICESSAATAGSGHVRSDGTDASARALRIIAAPVPQFHLAGYGTGGTYVQLADERPLARRSNRTLRLAVVSAQQAYASYARRHGWVSDRGTARGVYRVAVDRRLVSASTVVVSALMPLRAMAPGAGIGRTWIAVTVQVATGRLIAIDELFSDPVQGLRFFGTKWRAAVRRNGGGRCGYRDPPTATSYRHFALLPSGLTVGMSEGGSCGDWYAAVPYQTLRPYLSKLGATLIAGVRRPAGK